ncbi:SAM-dependent methyltransferase [Spirosoma flavus]
MPTPNNTLNQQYFDDVYKANEDPWSFETSPYEQQKYEATLAALPNKQYDSAFEIGCSIGVLTQMLAPKCHRLLSVDASELPLKAARKRLADYPTVTIQQMAIPDQFPDGSFDLILLSEVGYYFSYSDLARVRQLLIDHLRPNGHLLLVHWTPVVHDYPLTGDQVHDFFLETSRPGGQLTHLLNQRADTYRLDLFQKKVDELPQKTGVRA